MDTNEHCTLWVCADCYFAHHYGVTVTATTHTADGGEIEVPIGPDESVQAYIDKGCTIRYYAGDSDSPADRAPLSRLTGRLADATCSNHYWGQDVGGWGYEGDWDPCNQCGRAGRENGIDEFSQSQCDGCGSTLGGYRYRLALFPEV